MLKKHNKTFWVKIILIAAIVLCVLFIWSRSLKEAPESDAESSGVVSFLRPVLERLKIPEENWSHLVRKTAHFTEFFIIGLLLSALFRGRYILLLLLIGFIVAAVDETIQLFIPGRSGEFADVLLDTAGATAAILIVYAAVGLYRVRKKKKAGKTIGKESQK